MVAISRHVADQLIAFGVAADRVVVVPNGIAVLRPPVPAPASEDLLVIARHDANKNLRGLLKALATAQQQSASMAGRACELWAAALRPRRSCRLCAVRCPALKDWN